MNIVKKESSSVLNFNQDERAQSILRASKECQDLKKVERQVLEASCNVPTSNGQTELKTTPIKHVKDEELLVMVKKGMNLIFHMIGYRVSSDEESFISSVFFKTICNKYSNLSWKEVINAFQLCAMGDLDGFLPQGKNGEPDSKHYGLFSVEYSSRILNAYVKLKMSATNKVLKYLPEPKKDFSHLKGKIFEVVKIQKDKFLKDEKNPVFISVSRVHEVLKEKGLIKDLVFTAEDVTRALAEINSNKFITALDKKHVNERFKSNKNKTLDKWELEPRLYYAALRNKKYREIIECFKSNNF